MRTSSWVTVRPLTKAPKEMPSNDRSAAFKRVSVGTPGSVTEVGLR